MNNFFSNRVLYYPHIEFIDDTWLKCAILLWDKVYRIVPQSYVPKDSDDVIVAIENNFVHKIQLTQDDLEQTAKAFIDFTESIPFKPSGFSSSTYDVRLHSEKIDSRIIDYFKERSHGFLQNGFLRIDRDIANGYMFFLASTIARRRNIQKATDDIDMYSAMTYFDYDGQFDEDISSSLREEGVLNIIVENLIPADISTLPMSTIIDISNASKKSKIDFREKLSKTAIEMTKIEEPEFMKELLNDFKSDMLMVNVEKRKALSEFIKETAISYLYLGLPVCVASVIQTFFKNPSEFISTNAISQGLMLSGVSTLADSGKRFRASWNEKKNNYLLQIRNHMFSEKGAKLRCVNIHGLLNEYIND